jgi:hypothetical protein
MRQVRTIAPEKLRVGTRACSDRKPESLILLAQVGGNRYLGPDFKKYDFYDQ